MNARLWPTHEFLKLHGYRLVLSHIFIMVAGAGLVSCASFRNGINSLLAEGD